MIKITNYVTGGSDLTHGPLTVQAESSDGRIVYNTREDGPTIDGRRAWRGEWCGPDGRATGGEVPAALWASACEVMAAATGAEKAEIDRRNEARWAAERERDAFFDGIEKVRGGAYDPGADS
jgi:hypothetical protein